MPSRSPHFRSSASCAVKSMRYFASQDRLCSVIRCENSSAEHGRARADLELYADSNVALQRRLAVHGVRLTSLDSELRRLLAPSSRDLFTDSLALLNRVTEISEAAIYGVDGRDLKRLAPARQWR